MSAIFNSSVSPKQRVLYEDTVINTLRTTDPSGVTQMRPVDNIVYRSFVKKYNEQYTGLLKEQKELLSKYIASFADNGLELKLYLNEEVGRLKKIVNGALRMEEIFTDEGMVEKTKEVLSILEGFKEEAPTEEMISRVLKIQELTREIQSDD